MFNTLRRWVLSNPLDRLLKLHHNKEHPRCLVCWNRGLGDLPLGLYALCTQIRKRMPEAKIIFLTRSDLADAFAMLEDVQVIIDPDMKRGTSIDLEIALRRSGYTRSDFDLILEKVDSKRWLDWQLGRLTPKLQWNPEWDILAEPFALGKKKKYLGVHVSSETAQYYGYEKNWSQQSFQTLFDRMGPQQEVLLFGMKQEPLFQGAHIHDLRGKTSLFQMLSIIKNYCSHLLAPDSGVLSIVYYIDTCFPLHVVSLWADPRQGILKQKVPSPNTQLVHDPLVGDKECVENISVEQVIQALYCRDSAIK